jgi:uncharacterized surface protein with fasciclin (FAS1) repeats
MKRIALVAALAAASLVPASQAAAPDKNLVQTAQSAGQFTTLVKLATDAGLAGALTGKQQLTVFAPTDAAFAKVPRKTLATLAKDRNALRRVLLYHVVKGKVTSDKVVGLRSAKTLAGPVVRIRVTGKTVRVNASKVTAVDVLASNGVIHVIDRVLLPPAK